MKKLIHLLILSVLLSSCGGNAEKSANPEVTFIELGSVKCIPCQKMQKVISEVEKNYPEKVKTVFYDVWTEEGKKAAENFDFDVIPTQIFLDKAGNEFARHVGYFPYDDLEKVLKQKIN